MRESKFYFIACSSLIRKAVLEFNDNDFIYAGLIKAWCRFSIEFYLLQSFKHLCSFKIRSRDVDNDIHILGWCGLNWTIEWHGLTKHSYWRKFCDPNPSISFNLAQLLIASSDYLWKHLKWFESYILGFTWNHYGLLSPRFGPWLNYDQQKIH